MTKAIITTYPVEQTVIKPPTTHYYLDKHVKIEKHVKTIEAKTFARAIHLLDVELPENMKTLPARVFDRCYHLKKINLEHVNEIGDAAFKECRKLIELNLSNTTHIGRHAFSGCTELIDIEISDKLTEIGAYAFQNTSVVTITLPEGIKVIPKGLFQDCKLLVAVNLPDSIEVIEANAFANCQNLIFVRPLPKSIKQIDHTAFDSPSVVFGRIYGDDGITPPDTTPARCDRLFNQKIDPSLFCDVTPEKDDYDDDVDTLSVGVSVISRLHNFKIHTIRDLLKYNRQQLIEQNIAGIMSATNIQEAMVLKNLTLPNTDKHAHELSLGKPSQPKPDREQVATWLNDIGQTRLNEFDPNIQLDNIFAKKLPTTQLYEELNNLRKDYATVCAFAFACQ